MEYVPEEISAKLASNEMAYDAVKTALIEASKGPVGTVRQNLLEAGGGPPQAEFV